MFFPLQEWSRERVSMSRYTYIALLAAQDWFCSHSVYWSRLPQHAMKVL